MKGNALVILRWGLAFIFFYAAISALRHPDLWENYLPQAVLQSSPNVVLVGFSIYELLLAVWLFIGKKLAQAALVAAVTLAVVAIINFALFDLVFQDIGLAMAALALYELSRERDMQEEAA